MLKKVCVLFLSAMILGSAAPAGEKPAPGQEDENPAALKLKEAWKLKKTSFKKPKEEKARILLETATFYENIASEFPQCKAESAQACFRAGEIYRSLGMADKAEASFLEILAFDKSGEFAARSLLEVGHIYRRKKEYPKALEYYARVLGECPEVRDECADAVTWTGKVFLKMKAYDKGRQVLLGFADRFPEFPVDAIRNVDLAARSLIKEKRVDEARRMVERCVQRFESSMGTDAKRDKKVEKALQSMKAAEKLKIGKPPAPAEQPPAPAEQPPAPAEQDSAPAEQGSAPAEKDSGEEV